MLCYMLAGHFIFGRAVFIVHLCKFAAWPQSKIRPDQSLPAGPGRILLLLAGPCRAGPGQARPCFIDNIFPI